MINSTTHLIVHQHALDEFEQLIDENDNLKAMNSSLLRTQNDLHMKYVKLLEEQIKIKDQLDAERGEKIEAEKRVRTHLGES